jgi:hypothetical protein
MPMVLGVLALLCAAFGVFYNTNSLAVALRGGFDSLVAERNLSHFYPAFFIMSATCVTFYLLLAWCGAQFLRRRSQAVVPFTVLMIVEVVYFVIAGFGWRISGLGLSIAGAFGVANGGLVAQFVILLPLWGPLCAIRAKHRMS